MKPEIERIFGDQLKEQVQVFMDNFSGMTDFIEQNNITIKEIIDKSNEKVIEAVKQEKN